MLTAITKSAKVINVAGRKYNDVHKLKTEGPFYCPVCQGQVILKAGSLKIPHFSHLKSTNCLADTEPESRQHLQGKRDLYQWLQNERLDAQLEVYLPKIKQRPDILFKKNGQKYAFEFQCSPISLSSIKDRTNGYRSSNIEPIWILGGYPFQNRHGAIFHLTDFHWSLVQANEKSGLFLISYSPNDKSFHFLTNISSITSKKVKAAYEHFSLSAFSFPIQIPKKYITEEHIDENWFKSKRKWLQQRITFGKAFQDPFLRTIYECNLHPLLLSPIIGIPVDFMGVCKTHPAVWQFYIWHDSIRLLKVGDRITFNQVQINVGSRIKQDHIQFRELTFVSNSYHKRMVYLYLKLLEHNSYLREIRKGLFILNKSISFPKNMEEVIALEGKFLEL